MYSILVLLLIFVIPGITGFESPVGQYKELGLSLDQLLIKNPDSTFIGMASGQSMQGVGIYAGNLLLVDKSLGVSTGNVVVAIYNGSFL